jgi:hypothetical protein
MIEIRPTVKEYIKKGNQEKVAAVAAAETCG